MGNLAVYTSHGTMRHQGIDGIAIRVARFSMIQIVPPTMMISNTVENRIN